MFLRALSATLLLSSIAAGTAEAATYYSAWICRPPEHQPGEASGDPQYTFDGSYLEPLGGYMFPLAICPIPVDSNDPISVIDVHYKIEPLGNNVGHGISCRAEVRGLDSGLIVVSNAFQNNITGEYVGTLTLPPFRADGYYILVRCNLGDARIRSLATY